jgi:pimeloyl-ACP methyl ester carboxylesterase
MIGRTRVLDTRRRGLRPAMAGLVLVGLAGGPQSGAVRAAEQPPAVHERALAPKLKPCPGMKRARCGSIDVPLDRADATLGDISIAFELYTRRDRSRPSLGTIVAVEGGPGYSSTDSRSYYLELFRPLMDRRRLLLVDNRGTGLSGAILCRPLQSYPKDYVGAVGKCGRQLGDAADLYGSGNAADDMAAVLDHLNIDRIDLYGDSYGTFYSQTFAVRHPDRVRSVVLDAAYFVAGTDPFYIDTNRALRDAFRWSCQRSPACARKRGSTMARVEELTKSLRKNVITGPAANADGVVKRVNVDVGGLIYLVTAAATSPTLYRELDAAIRAALRPTPYNLPLLRLARETYWEGGAGPVRSYSEGLYMAVACNDYPQAYDMTSPKKERPEQYRATLDELRATQPDVFAPFTIREWVTAPVEYFDSCIKWPVPSRVDPPVPPGAQFPDTPVLVLNGDLDSLTSPEGGQQTADAFPNSTFVEVANMTHVTAISDFGRCASRIVRRFVRTLDAGDTSCAAGYNEMRLVDRFARSSKWLAWKGPQRRTARVAAATVGDVIARWWGMYTSSGVGLRGGSFTTTGLNHVKWRLDHVRWVRDVAVSGTASWDRTSGQVRASVKVEGDGARPGNLRLRWNDWEPTASATAVGTLGGEQVRFTFPAP